MHPTALPQDGPPRDLRLLLVEDDLEVAAGAARALGEAGWRVVAVADGADARRRACEDAFDVIVLDRLLPGLDGVDVVAGLRRAGCETPVLMLTALGSVSDRVSGLEAGADDYLVKPYSSEELKARAAALVRRSARARPERTRLAAGPLALDLVARSVLCDGEPVALLPLEFRLLEVLVRNAGRVVTRAMLLEQVWGFSFDPRTNIVETHLSRLRRKLEPAGGAALISTVRGAGYVLGAG